MRKLSELGISNLPWELSKGCVDSLSFVCGRDRYNIVVNHHLEFSTQAARLIAAAPKLYDAGWKTEAVLAKLFTLDEFAALLKSGAADALIACCDELRAALAEAAGESEVRK